MAREGDKLPGLLLFSFLPPWAWSSSPELGIARRQSLRGGGGFGGGGGSGGSVGGWEFSW